MAAWASCTRPRPPSRTWAWSSWNWPASPRRRSWCSALVPANRCASRSPRRCCSYSRRIRDEAHRFAITYHRALRAKRTLQTELTQIPGIGPVTAKKLLQTFGSAAKVREADPSELAVAIGEAASRKVLAWREAPPPKGQ